MSNISKATSRGLKRWHKKRRQKQNMIFEDLLFKIYKGNIPKDAKQQLKRLYEKKKIRKIQYETLLKKLEARRLKQK